jgi:hypothetical protein
MRILLSEGSGLTSRQVAGQLGSLGHTVEILSSSKISLTRFTRHVRAVHDVPRFGLDPFSWLAAAERIAAERKTDLLFPTQEQVTVLSARQKYLRVATIVPFRVQRHVRSWGQTRSRWLRLKAALSTQMRHPRRGDGPRIFNVAPAIP